MLYRSAQNVALTVSTVYLYILYFLPDGSKFSAPSLFWTLTRRNARPTKQSRCGVHGYGGTAKCDILCKPLQYPFKF